MRKGTFTSICMCQLIRICEFILQSLKLRVVREFFFFFLFTSVVCCVYKTSGICCIHIFFLCLLIFVCLIFFFFRFCCCYIMESWLPPKWSLYFSFEFCTTYRWGVCLSVHLCAVCARDLWLLEQKTKII